MFLVLRLEWTLLNDYYGLPVESFRTIISFLSRNLIFLALSLLSEQQNRRELSKVSSQFCLGQEVFNYFEGSSIHLKTDFLPGVKGGENLSFVDANCSGAQCHLRLREMFQTDAQVLIGLGKKLWRQV